MRHHTWLLLALALAALLLVPAAASALTYDQAVDQLLAEGYPQTSRRASPARAPRHRHGVRRSPSDNARAEYLAKKLRGARFPGPPRGGAARCDGIQGRERHHLRRTYVASTFGGVRATARRHHGALVYVGAGTATDVAPPATSAARSPSSTLELSSWWMNWPWTEPALAGAAGIIYTGAADDTRPAEPTALASFDAEYRYALAPVVYISQLDGMGLKAALVCRPTLEATMVNDVRMTLARRGGRGYNVAATLPGTVGAPSHRHRRPQGRLLLRRPRPHRRLTSGMLMAKAIQV